MDLALVSGHGPPAGGDLQDRTPLVRAEDAVIVGFRDAKEQARGRQPAASPELLALDLAAVRAAGAPVAAERVLAHLTRPGAPEGFWVHVDADALDDAVMPAVAYRQPGGLSPDELVTVLAAAMATGRVGGVEVTIYNPARDPDETAGATPTDALVPGLGALPPVLPDQRSDAIGWSRPVTPVVPTVGCRRAPWANRPQAVACAADSYPSRCGFRTSTFGVL